TTSWCGMGLKVLVPEGTGMVFNSLRVTLDVPQCAIRVPCMFSSPLIGFPDIVFELKSRQLPGGSRCGPSTGRHTGIFRKLRSAYAEIQRPPHAELPKAKANRYRGLFYWQGDS